jgi:hypothetical protein
MIFVGISQQFVVKELPMISLGFTNNYHWEIPRLIFAGSKRKNQWFFNSEILVNPNDFPQRSFVEKLFSQRF